MVWSLESGKCGKLPLAVLFYFSVRKIGGKGGFGGGSGRDAALFSIALLFRRGAREGSVVVGLGGHRLLRRAEFQRCLLACGLLGARENRGNGGEQGPVDTSANIRVRPED